MRSKGVAVGPRPDMIDIVIRVLLGGRVESVNERVDAFITANLPEQCGMVAKPHGIRGASANLYGIAAPVNTIANHFQSLVALLIRAFGGYPRVYAKRTTPACGSGGIHLDDSVGGISRRGLLSTTVAIIVPVACRIAGVVGCNHTTDWQEETSDDDGDQSEDPAKSVIHNGVGVVVPGIVPSASIGLYEWTWQLGAGSGTLPRMKQRLAGKRALVTAAAQGIGEATARAFAAAGASVVATDINAAKLADLDAVEGITTAVLDVTDRDAISAFFSGESHFDVLFNCAGFVHHGSVLECTDDEWDMAFDLNVKSMFRMSQAVLPGMVEAGGGSIINISSIAAHKGLVNRFAYGTTKAAVVGLTKSIAADFVTQGIRCNAIAPGTVQSPSLDGRIAAFDDPVAARKQFIARQPMGRLGTAEEIAHMALYLASDESIFTTGTLMKVDGGMSI